MTILALQIEDGLDDGSEPGSGTPNLSGASEIAMLPNSVNTWVALRFTDVTVPQGSTINAAGVSLYFHNAAYDSPDVNAYAEDVDNSAALSTATNNISSRALTSASVTWTATNLGTGWKSPGSLAAVVQEVVSRAGWVSGNALTILLDARTADNEFRFRSYEYDTTLAAKLDITYTEPPSGDGQPAAARGRQVPGMRRAHGHQGW